jgi:hypothetical protein
MYVDGLNTQDYYNGPNVIPPMCLTVDLKKLKIPYSSVDLCGSKILSLSLGRTCIPTI